MARACRSGLLALVVLGGCLVGLPVGGPAGAARAATPASTAVGSTARAASVRMSGGLRLHADVDPDLRGSRSWRFRLQRRSHGKWRTIGTYRTKGHAETRDLAVRAGTYRVRVLPGHGRRGRVSKAFSFSPSSTPAPTPTPTPTPPTPTAPAPEPSTPAPVPTPTPTIPPPPSPTALVSLGGSMTPQPDPTVTDYSVTCDGGSVNATVTASHGGSVLLDGDQEFDFDGTATLPLDPGQSVSWALRLPGQAPIAQHARCLPADFPTWTVERPGQPASQWYLFSPSIFAPTGNHYAIVADDYGTPVWWMSTGTEVPADMTLLPSGEVAWTTTAGTFSLSAVYRGRHWDGTPGAEIGTGLGLDQHDLVALPNGHYLALRYAPRDCPAQPSECTDMTAHGGSTTDTLIDGEVVEFAADGTLVWSWSTRGRIPYEEAAQHLDLDAKVTIEGQDYWDYAHLNSVEPDGDGIIISARNTDAVYRIDRATGAVDWKLGGTPRAKSLDVVGDASDPFTSSQHDARLAADGTLSIYDNGSAVVGRAPRVLRVRIDPSARRANVIGTVTDPSATSSSCCGGARAVPGGGMAISWSGMLPGLITEVDAHGAPVLRMATTSGFTYRVRPVQPGVVGARALRAGMDAMHPRTSP